MQKPVKVLQGGTSAGKTHSIIPILIDKAARTPRLKITIVSETLPAAKDGPVDIFQEVMQDTGRWNEFSWIGSPMQYTFKNKSRIQFKAFDTEGKAKASGKRDILFLNEANHISYPIADALMVRSEEVYIDYNPNNSFWVHKEVIPDDDCDFKILTYKDNECIPSGALANIIKRMEKAFHNPHKPTDTIYEDANIKDKYWANWCKVYVHGLIGSLEGVIFEEHVNWEIINDIPKEAEFLGMGLDFGYTNDPTAVIAAYKYNGKKIYDEILYDYKLSNSKINDRIRASGVDVGKFIIAESAEPKSIDDLRLLGLVVIPATKGKDSVNNGIDNLKEEKFYVTARSGNIHKELRNYSWRLNKEGEATNIPADAYNHSIDAIRYFESDKNQFFVI